MSTLLKKFVLSFLSFLVLFLSVAPSFSVAKAADAANWYNQDFVTWFGKVSDQSNPSEIFGERYTSAQVEWVIYGLFAFLINHTTPSDLTSACSGGNIVACSAAVKSFFDSLNKLNETSQINNGQSIASLIFADRPLSGISYVKEKITNLRLVPVAHAQAVGFGFDALTLVQEMWKSVRDIAFGLFVLVAIIFAFMIMFRVKISPQIVISVQSALPKIIIALILVTFSYAIAGFLIDFMYVVIGLVSVFMAPLIPVTWFQFVHYDALGVFNLLTVGFMSRGIFGLLILYLVPLLVLLVIMLLVSAVLAVASGGIATPLIFVMLALIVVVMIVMLVMFIKTIWALFKAFANILLLTIFAPLQIALGVLVPNFGFGQWVKNYLSNLSVFVVTGVLSLFAWIFEIMAWNQVFNGTTLTLSPTNSTNPWPPLLGSGNSANLLFLGVSFVLFTLIPKSTEIVQGLISGKPFAYGSAIGEAMGPIKLGSGIAGSTYESILKNQRNPSKTGQLLAQILQRLGR
jgi:hypothetical protein